MAEEMMSERIPWESDEAEDWESEDWIAEADEGAEDIGERVRRRRRRSRGVRGFALPARDGVGRRKFQFPVPLATAADTNRGFQRIDQLETRLRAQQRSDVSAAGLVTLAIGGGLAVWGAVKASEQGGFTLKNWASQVPSQAAAFVAAGQLAHSGARLVTSGINLTPTGIAADASAAALLAVFAFGTLSTDRVSKRPIVLTSVSEMDTKLSSLKPNDIVVTREEHQTWEVIADSDNKNTYRLIAPE